MQRKLSGKTYLYISIIYFFYFLIANSSLVFAADIDYDRQFQYQRKLIEEEYIKELMVGEEVEPLKEKYKLDYGGWVSSIYRLYREVDNDAADKDSISSIWTQDLRLWGKLTFLNNNYLYVRLRNAYSLKVNESSYTGVAAGGDNEGPEIDMGYFSLSLNKLRVNIGRQYLTIGRGLAYSAVHDGILFRKYSSPWLLKGFFSHSLRHEDNIDYSIPGYDKDSNDRYFLGLEAGYLGIPANALYAFYLMQKDRSKEHPEDVDQTYRYNSHYFGLGLTGKRDNLSYWSEVIKEAGSSYTDAAYGLYPLSKKTIDAWAAIVGVRYESDMAAKPATEIEFAYGSGDKDRDNVTNTMASIAGGNLYEKDTNFLYFGSYYGGYALSPRLSNLFIYKIGQSLQPFYFYKPLKDVTVGGKYFVYIKDKKKAGISDTDATLSNNFVGTELNLYLYWKMTENLYFSLRYGIFYPGDAYADNSNSNTKYLYSRLTLTF